MDENCLFCKIIANEIPSSKIFEDDAFLAFLDINPVNPGHTLVIPKKHFTSFDEVPREFFEGYFSVIQKVAGAVKMGMGADGYNIFQNNGKAAGQAVFHIHFHVVPRFDGDGFMQWQGKPYEEDQVEEVSNRIIQNI